MAIRRLKATFAVLAVLVVMVSNTAPAMAQDPWADCEWTLHWSWFWGYYFTCDAVYDWEPAGGDWEPAGGDWESVFE